MKEIIRALVELQKIDNEIYKYEEIKRKLANKLEELKELVRKMEQSIEQRKEKLKEAEAWYQDQMDAIKQIEERIHKVQAALGKATKTKEYLMYQRELDNLRRQKQARQEEASKLWEVIRDFKQTIEEEQERINEMKKETEEEKGSSAHQIKEIENIIEEYNKKRQVLLPSIPPHILRKYEQIKARREGIAIVKVTNGCCEGCHVAIRPQQYIVLLRQESLEQCPSCSRFIYVDEETIEQLKRQREEETA